MKKESTQNKNNEGSIRTLLKPSDLTHIALEVISLCEPHSCGSHCNSGSANTSPDSENDLLF
jgi:hypothetical protein